MTIYKQVAAIIAAGLVVLFGVVSIDTIKHSTDIMKSQMATSAQDTATVVAISLSVNQDIDDQSAIETLSNSVFDSGYYSRLRLVAMDGDTLFEKSRPLVTEQVPSWFMQFVSLESMVGRADVINGWSVVGSVEITLHPGFAYMDLYQRTTSSLKWFSLMFVSLMLILWLVLHYLLAPLRKVTEQADAIQRNDFQVQERLPKTLELERVVSTINRLSIHARKAYLEQQMLWRKHQKMLFVDPVTALPNRRRLLLEIERLLSDRSRTHASVSIIKVVGYKDLQIQKGYDVAKKKLLELAVLLRQEMSRDDTLVGRLSDNEFAVVSQCNADKANSRIDRLVRVYQNGPGQEDNSVSLSAATTSLKPGGSVSAVLSALDLTLVGAAAQRPYQSLVFECGDRALPEGNTEWFSWFTRVLAEQRIYLEAQPVFDNSSRVLHRELLVRARHDDGSSLAAGLFMPMAEKLGFSHAIYTVVREQITALVSKKSDVPFAMNFPEMFLSNLEETAHLLRILGAAQRYPRSLLVELPFPAVLRDRDSVYRIAKQVRLSGQLFGFDHLDLEYPIEILKDINPDYVKVSARLLRGITEEENDEVYRSFRRLATTLDIDIIAVGIDKVSLLQHLRSLDIDGLQGNLLGVPEVME